MEQMESLTEEKRRLIEHRKIVNEDLSKMLKSLDENQKKKIETLKKAFIEVNEHLST